MMHHNDRFTGFSQFFENVDDGNFCSCIYTLKRFVHNVNFCFLGKRTRKKHSLLLPATELTDLPISIGTHADTLHSFKSNFSFPSSGSSNPTELSIGSH